MSTEHTMHEPIAVVGMACRFPGSANSPSKLWQLLSEPRDVLSDLASRFASEKFYHPDGKHRGTTNVKKAYLLEEDYKAFDASFFNITPREAAAIDPQQRLLLETVYEALEYGGFAVGSLRGSKTSVFAGVMTADYYDVQVRDIDTMPEYMATGTHRSIISNRLSYFFDWKGPSMTIDTACSSSLVAMHLAVQSLRNGESTMSVVGGSNLIFGPEMFVSESKLKMLSPDGRSRMWDAGANGYARGEGIAALVLKPLSDALRDGDHVSCIIRETGVNQDGRTRGITMPSPTAQAALIRDTYVRAGLDPLNKADRCQYFEAHGTGTSTGDPIEASAIHSAFFPSSRESTDEDFLYVGSVKTVIGHLEGCAGLAGFLKVALALHHAEIPANMHFKDFNPEILPFSPNLRLPLERQAWPSVPYGGVRRASVNSFGFGGTNAHVIVESFDRIRPDLEGIVNGHRQQAEDATRNSDDPLPSKGPLVLSAASKSSLAGNIEQLSAFLKESPAVHIDSLAWTLQSRRSDFPFRAAFTATSLDGLISQLDDSAKTSAMTISDTPAELPQSQKGRTGGILGIFTGQGAQWAGMGRELISSSYIVRGSIEKAEQTLSSLPDGPSWSLMDELMADDSTSKLSSAEISQPLCTAIQIALVDLLQCCNVRFDAVVGHSSGEIGAAYACGVISAADAIKIAYYRGKCARLAHGSSGETGAMMAVGISFEEASKFCQHPRFVGRLAVAASNAPSSVTLSGDEDAVQEAKTLFDGKGTFARQLRVDTAYHSHHMKPCATEYLGRLKAAGIQAQLSLQSCDWFSSVHPLPNGQAPAGIEDVYWISNMVDPVLFSPAIENALSQKSGFGMCLEVGPHAALKGPALQTVKQALRGSMPYVSCLVRGEHGVESFARSIGDIWANLGPEFVSFKGYRRAFSSDAPIPPLTVGLPSYTWDHERAYWHESQLSKSFRSSAERYLLIGTRCVDDMDDYLRWRNHINMLDVPWLDGHRFQGRALFPAAGYIVMVLEASQTICSNHVVSSIEITEISFLRAMVIGDGQSGGVETTFTTRIISSSTSEMFAEVACYSFVDEKGPETREKNFSARVRFQLNNVATRGFFDRLSPPDGSLMRAVGIDQFYESCRDCQLDYTGLFRALTSLQRRMDSAKATMSKVPGHDQDDGKTIHASLLDCAFQTLFAAFAAPKDGGLWTTFLPTSIERLHINTTLTEEAQTVSDYHIDTFVTDRRRSTEICGDIDIRFNTDRVWIQVEGLKCSSTSKPLPSNDKELFACNVWSPSILSADADEAPDSNQQDRSDASELELVELADRLSYHYFLRLAKIVPREKVAELEIQFRRLFDYMDYLFPLVRSGKHPFVKKEWEFDRTEMLDALVVSASQKFPAQIDLELISALGKKYPAIVQGEASHLETLLQNDMLTRWYQQGLGFPRSNSTVAKLAALIANQHPHIKILEIGAGTGGTTRSVLQALGNSLASYSFTDVSPGFFRKAQEVFRQHANKMHFSVLDVEKDVLEQGYTKGAFDLVIASNVLHATKSLTTTLRNARQLLKPGGYLILMEITNQNLLRYTFMMGGLPGWWLGADDGRQFSPTVSPEKWNSVLQNSGFSGIDRIVHDLKDSSRRATSVMVSQAIDDRVSLLRQPQLSLQNLLQNHTFLLVGGQEQLSQNLLDEIEGILRKPHFPVVQIHRLAVIDEVASLTIPPAATVLIATDLDEPVFKDLTPLKHQAIKSLFEQAKEIVWLTSGSRARNPYHNMSIALGRCLMLEYPHVRSQFLDVDLDEKKGYASHATAVTEMLLRHTILGLSEFSQQNLLWPREQELVIEGGKVLIPRAVSHTHLNTLLNSARRPITKHVSPANIRIQLSTHSTVIEAREAKQIGEPRAGYLRVRATYSSVSSVRVTGDAFFFVCIGTVLGIGAGADTAFTVGQTVVALSSENASIIDVPVHVAEQMRCQRCGAHGSGSHVFSSAANLIAQAVLDSLPSKATILLHEPDEKTAVVISQRASERGIRVICTTAKAPTKQGWIYVDASAPTRVLQALIPAATVNRFVDFCTAEPNSQSSPIYRCLAPSCEVLQRDSLFGNVHKADSKASLVRLGSILRLATSFDCGQAQSDAMSQYEIPANEIVGTNVATLRKSVVDWSRAEEMPVTISPIDADILFHDNKTYLLVGFAGGLGQSICLWMAKHGAKYLALTSRNPQNIKTAWLEELAANGAEVKLIKADISSKSELERVHRDIRVDFPEIGGVANAAMVLDDNMFANMSFESMMTALRPKVDISRNLDEMFPGNTLDFFLMFSSISYVCGKFGQSNYVAGNAFMVALAAQRRSRGLAASVIDIGVVVGLGYVQESGVGEDKNFWKDNFATLSEPELHYTVAAAILTGKAESQHPSEIITGLQRTTVDPTTSSQPGWTKNPKLSHFVDLQLNSADEQGRGPMTSLNVIVPVKTQLAKANTAEESGQILRKGFSVALGLMLQAAPETIGDKSLVEAGADSLIAVEVRSWFMKELGVDISILDVLGGATVVDLCANALSKLAGRSAESTTPGSDTPSSSSSVKAGSLLTSVASTTEATAPLSYAQSRIYFLSLFLEDPTTFNITISYRIRGPLQATELSRAFEKVALHHEALRTGFVVQDETGEPMQQVLATAPFRLEHRRIQSEREVDQELDCLRQHEYDLEVGETLKATLLSLSPDTHFLILGNHHIALDGVSGQVLLRDLDLAYRRQPLKSAYQYTKFSREQRDLVAEALHDEIAFWSNEFDTLPPTLPLLPNRKVQARSKMAAYGANVFKFTLDSNTASRVRKLSRQLNATGFHMHLSLLQLLLFKMIGEQDLCIGVADANRSDELVDSLGFFVNLLPMRFQVNIEDSFEKLVAKTRQKALAALKHARLPFDVLLSRLAVPRSETHSPLFQIALNYRMGTFLQAPIGECQMELLSMDDARTAFDISVDIEDTKDGVCHISFTGQEYLYSIEHLRLLSEQYVQLLGDVTEDLSLQLNEYSIRTS